VRLMRLLEDLYVCPPRCCLLQTLTLPNHAQIETELQKVEKLQATVHEKEKTMFKNLFSAAPASSTDSRR
jgi:hypothetical protein